MTYLFSLFLIELLIIFFLSRFVTQKLSLLFYRLTRKEHTAMYLLAILFFPGTLIHELAHFLTAAILLVPVGHMEFVPKLHGTSVKLGSVQIGRTDPLRRALIGLAPLFVGIACIFAALYYFSSFPLSPWVVNIVLVMFVVFEVGNTMFSSKRDVEGLPALLLVSLAIGICLYLLGVKIPEAWWEYIGSAGTIAFMQQLCWYMLVPIGIDAGIILLSKILGK